MRVHRFEKNQQTLRVVCILCLEKARHIEQHPDIVCRGIVKLFCNPVYKNLARAQCTGNLNIWSKCLGDKINLHF